MIALGIILEVYGLLDARHLLNLARSYTDQWWLILILIALQALLFTFALAGSVFLWVVAPLYPPVTATFILTAGGLVGGMGAYLFSQFLTEDWIKKIEKSHTYRLLHQQDNFFTLFALRVFPAFPHAVVNYSSGVLTVKKSHFIAAAILGIGIKSYVYCNVIYNASSTASVEELIDIKTLGPLLILSMLSLAGVVIHYRLTRK